MDPPPLQQVFMYELIDKLYRSQIDTVEIANQDYFKLVAGSTVSAKESRYWGGDIPWATPGDMPSYNSITCLSDTKKHINETALELPSTKVLSPNSVLISTVNFVGRLAITQIPLVANQAITSVTVKDENRVAPVYLVRVFKHLEEHIRSLSTGNTIKYVSRNKLKTINIPLPSLTEQLQLVDELEKSDPINKCFLQLETEWYQNCNLGRLDRNSICQCGTERLIERCSEPDRMRAFLLMGVFVDQLVSTHFGKIYNDFAIKYKIPVLRDHPTGSDGQSASWLIYSRHGYDDLVNWQSVSEIAQKSLSVLIKYLESHAIDTSDLNMLIQYKIKNEFEAKHQSLMMNAFGMLPN